MQITTAHAIDLILQSTAREGTAVYDQCDGTVWINEAYRELGREVMSGNFLGVVAAMHRLLDLKESSDE